MIKNITKKTIVSRDKKILRDIFSKSIGLMFSKKQDKALVFVFKKEQLHCIHMFFVFFPIDIIFLNEKKEVVEIKKSLRPFTVYHSRKMSKCFIETKIKNKIDIGDKIGF